MKDLNKPILLNYMAQIDILVEGYTSDDASGEYGEDTTACTMCLVREKDIIMVTDPGTLKNQDIMRDALAKHGLTVEDINIVFVTHMHPDHVRNIGMFPTAKMIEYFGEWEEDRCEDRNDKISDDIQIIETPGHSFSGLTLLVKTDKGKVAICGDVFWKEGLPDNDPYADDVEKLAESRKKVLEVADFIIPGHAGEYKVKK